MEKKEISEEEVVTKSGLGNFVFGVTALVGHVLEKMEFTAVDRIGRNRLDEAEKAAKQSVEEANRRAPRP